MFHVERDDSDEGGTPERGPLDMCPEHERGNVLMMLMAGGDEAEFRRIKYRRRFSKSWQRHAWRCCAFFREPLKTPDAK